MERVSCTEAVWIFFLFFYQEFSISFFHVKMKSEKILLNLLTNYQHSRQNVERHIQKKHF